MSKKMKIMGLGILACTMIYGVTNNIRFATARTENNTIYTRDGNMWIADCKDMEKTIVIFDTKGTATIYDDEVLLVF